MSNGVSSSGPSMLARTHSLLGVVPLGAFLFVHLRDQWPALGDRELWVDRALHSMSRPWAIGLVLVPLGLHALLGCVRLVRAPSVGDTLSGPGALRVIQAVTGALVLGFVVYHVGQVWAVGQGPHSSPRAVYAVLWQTLGRPLDISIYLIGVSAVCFHLAHGLSRAAVTFGLAKSARAVLLLRAGAGVVGFLLWAMFLQLLGHFALGIPLVSGGG
jgi:succinate dehydrogenase / fumarate reductase cytochrome b subunit